MAELYNPSQDVSVSTATPKKRVRKSRSKAKAAPPPPPPTSLLSKAGAFYAYQTGVKRVTETVAEQRKLLQRRTNKLQRDVKKQVRRSPLESLLAGLGVGLFLGVILTGLASGFGRSVELAHGDSAGS